MLKIFLFQPFRIEKSTPTDLISTSYLVCHMELDRYRPGYLLYTEKRALMTSDGTTTHLIAGNSTQWGYREGVGGKARFSTIIGGFAQISEKHVVVADRYNHCMRLIDRSTNKTSVFSGQCKSRGYEGGSPGQFKYPYFVVIDKQDKNQLFIADSSNAAVRNVTVNSRVAGTFVQSDSLKYIRGITQDEKIGDLYVTAYHALYRITYTQRTVSLISGSPGDNSRYRDSTLLDSRFDWPYELILNAPETLLVADSWNNKLRLLDMNSDKVTTLTATNSMDKPASLLLTNNSLYVGQYKKITQYKCEY